MTTKEKELINGYIAGKFTNEAFPESYLIDIRTDKS
jgi:hypothetical protein